VLGKLLWEVLGVSIAEMDAVILNDILYSWHKNGTSYFKLSHSTMQWQREPRL